MYRKNIEDITWPREIRNLSSSVEKYFTSERSERVVVKRTKDHFSKMISSHVRLSYRFYQFVTTLYTTDFNIINMVTFCNQKARFNILKVTEQTQFKLKIANLGISWYYQGIFTHGSPIN